MSKIGKKFEKLLIKLRQPAKKPEKLRDKVNTKDENPDDNAACMEVTDASPTDLITQKSTLSNPTIPVRPFSQDELVYRMNHANRGVAIIINNRDFSGLPSRKGTNVDAVAMRKRLQELDFEVFSFTNVNREKLITIVENASKANHSDKDCFCLVLLSYGEHYKIYATDGTIYIHDFLEPFKGNNCVTLVGKPKLFFIQACSVASLYEYVDLQQLEISSDEADAAVPRIPSDADFFLVQSSVPDDTDPVKGSLFIQALSDVLGKHGKQMDILRMMNRVNEKVSAGFDAVYGDAEAGNKKRIASVTSMLTKDVVFRKNESLLIPLPESKSRTLNGQNDKVDAEVEETESEYRDASRGRPNNKLDKTDADIDEDESEVRDFKVSNLNNRLDTTDADIAEEESQQRASRMKGCDIVDGDIGKPRSVNQIFDSERKKNEMVSMKIHDCYKNRNTNEFNGKHEIKMGGVFSQINETSSEMNKDEHHSINKDYRTGIIEPDRPKTQPSYPLSVRGNVEIAHVDKSRKHQHDMMHKHQHYMTHKHEYDMTHSHRGLAVIINNRDFVIPLTKREGTDSDAVALKGIFESLGFQVAQYNNIKLQTFQDITDKVSKQDHTNCDCFCMIVLSHGNEGVIYMTDGLISVNDIFEPFKRQNCPTLRGKPKLFFIQACRGSSMDDGVDMPDGGADKVDTDMAVIPDNPPESDFLVAFSVTSGRSSWRNSSNGSWFVQKLAEELKQSSDDVDLLTMMTRVNRRVAYEFESQTSSVNNDHKKQVPCVTSLLTKDIFFRSRLLKGTA